MEQSEMAELLKGVDDKWLLWLKQCVVEEQMRRLDNSKKGQEDLK